jgi:DNA end-binding protein Ku
VVDLMSALRRSVERARGGAADEDTPAPRKAAAKKAAPAKKSAPAKKAAAKTTGAQKSTAKKTAEKPAKRTRRSA